MTRIRIKKLFTTFALVFLFLPLVSFAQLNSNAGGLNSVSGSLNSSAGCTSGFCFQNPLKINTICGLVKQILSIFLALGTPVAVLFLVYAGFMFVLARGNPTKLGTAKRNITHVILGICIFLGAWLLGQVVANTINTVAPGTVNTSGSCS
ncbi:MAG: pilin [bacterium]